MRTFRIRGLLVAGAIVLAGCAGGASPAEPATLTLEAVDLGFTPKTLEVTAGEPVKLVLKNSGALEHDFTVMEFPMEGTAAEAGGSGHVMGGDEAAPDLHVSALGGQSASLTFTPSKPGSYEFWCTVSGHKEAGMIGTLVVKAP